MKNVFRDLYVVSRSFYITRDSDRSSYLPFGVVLFYIYTLCLAVVVFFEAVLKRSILPRNTNANLMIFLLLALLNWVICKRFFSLSNDDILAMSKRITLKRRLSIFSGWAFSVVLIILMKTII